MPETPSHDNAKKPYRSCRIERMEQRQLLAANPILLGSVYYEDASGNDSPAPDGTGDLIEVSWTGGETGTQLTELVIEGDYDFDGITDGDVFFDTEDGGLGVYQAVGFSVTLDGIDDVDATVSDGGTSLTLVFTNFDAGDHLTISIDVDEYDSVKGTSGFAEGQEFQDTLLTATFEADHYHDAIPTGIYMDDYDTVYGSMPADLELPPDRYLPETEPSDEIHTAGFWLEIEQEALPISISGRVYEDLNANNQQDPASAEYAGDFGIMGVTLSLYIYENDAWTDTGRTAVTNIDGDYEFDDLEPGTYRVVETQPDGYISVGATAGTVGGETRGIVITVDEIGDIGLEGGEHSIRNDFAEVYPAALSGYVYHDVDNDGQREPGEDGIGGVWIRIPDRTPGAATGATIPTLTDENGYWQYTNLLPGDYWVQEFQPDDYRDGLDTAGTAGGTAQNDWIGGFHLDPGQSGREYNFGEILTSTISGYVYVDDSNDGIFNTNEDPIAGVTLTLYDDSGELATTVTDTTGYYEFTDLLPATYRVVETHPTDYRDGLDTPGFYTGPNVPLTHIGTADDPGDEIHGITLPSAVHGEQYNFGELRPARICGNVYADLDGDLLYDEGEPQLEGVTIYLLDASGERIQSMLTDEEGHYCFRNLDPGVYGVEEIQPPDYFQGATYPGTQGGDLDPPDRILNVDLGPGEHGRDYDFCEIVPATISGYVFQDGDAITIEDGEPRPDPADVRDGQRTADDTPIAGVMLQLGDVNGGPILVNGQPVTTVTDANGYYEFTRVRPGVYSVYEVHPDGYVDSIDTPGTNGGEAFNVDTPPSELLLQTFSGDHDYDAIGLIEVGPGEHAQNNNFSEVVYEELPPPPIFPPNNPPPTPRPRTPAPMAAAPPVAPRYPIAPTLAMNPQYLGAGGVTRYTWHLSVINAGQVRRGRTSSEAIANADNPYFDPETWTGQRVDQGYWTVADSHGNVQRQFNFGMHAATPIVGDFNGDGMDEAAVFIDGVWFVDLNGNGRWDSGDFWAKLGRISDAPVVGDWDGDGKSDIGIFGPEWEGDSKAILAEPGLPTAENTLKGKPKNPPPEPEEATTGWRVMKRTSESPIRSDLIDHVFEFGMAGDKPMAGDFNGDGVATIAIFREGIWFIDMDGDGRWSKGDLKVRFGQRGDIPIVGDFNNDGIDDLGIYRDGTWHLDTNGNHQLDAHDRVFKLGTANGKPVVGDFNGDGTDEIAVYEGGRTGKVVQPQQEATE